MQLLDGTRVLSATDLVGFLACEHLTGLEIARLGGLVARPERDDPELDLIRARGYEHEARYRADLEASGRRVTAIELDGSASDRLGELRAAAAATEEAIRRGDDVIFQATFFDGRWRGHADFLLRVETPSDLGPWSYEVADTKLARHVKASAILQICSYVEGLMRIQGRQPEELHVVLGGKARETASFRVADAMAYYRLAKRLFEGHVGSIVPADPPEGTYPEPVEHCDVCRWDEVCSGRRRRDDDLSLVAGITSRQRRALKERGVPTRRGFAELSIPVDPPLDGVGETALERSWRQARIQVRQAPGGPVLHELIDPNRLRDGTLEPDRGLLILPEPRPGDLFFDIEGDPFAFDEGIDYLFGVLEPAVLEPDGRPRFHALWARDETGAVTLEAERAAFERLIDLFMDRLRADPAIHIYHYAAYEPTALRRLMGRHGTREDEVDALLRGHVLVDLYRAVRQGVRASVESYSIKKLEPLYDLRREVGLKDAGSSVVAFEAWLGGGSGRHDEATLAEIEGYNRDDVVSTLRLRDWLEARRRDLERELGTSLQRPGVGDGAASEERAAELGEAARVAEALAPGGHDDGSPDGHARWLLAQLLSWHRREEASFWRRWYELIGDLTDDERVDAPEPIGRVTYLGPVGEVDRSEIHRYSFPPQEHEVEPERIVKAPGGATVGTVESVDERIGFVDVRRRKGSEPPEASSLIPFDHVDTAVLRGSLLRIGSRIAEAGLDEEGPYRVARDLLQRLPPRAGQVPGGHLAAPDEEAVDAAVRAALALDESYLAIQGPPGSGKTYTGAKVAVALVAAGRKVGVTANSHKVIGHLLDGIAREAARAGVAVRIGQKPGKDRPPTHAEAWPLGSVDAVAAALATDAVDVVGGTAWTWAHGGVAGSLDVLIVDEAGQMSLANALAVSQAAGSLILLGDPQQLDQPVAGAHPPGAERSALAHLLDGARTIPPERGLFVESTRRLHPDICRFTSDAFYEGRLTPHPGLERQLIAGDVPAADGLGGTGIRFIPVAHVGNSNASAEEAAVVGRLVESFLEAPWHWIDEHGTSRRLALADILVITPYNAHLAELERALPVGTHAGTVDMFQGQEAPISIYSMASSSPADAPRGMEFLYSLNRLNVATSRARALAIVVASPELLRVRARTPRQIQLANGLARLVELATIVGPPGAIRIEDGSGGQGAAASRGIGLAAGLAAGLATGLPGASSVDP